MPRAHIVRDSEVVRSTRVMQLEGLFELPPSERSRLEWNVDLPLDEQPWNIGLIVGPSGCGKSTVARELFGQELVNGFEWPEDRSILDAFPSTLPIKDLTGILSSVGFSSPPSWLRPFSRLSNGEQFRVTLARALAEREGLFVVDEFTSVVDRTVAKIGSAAVAKTVRRMNRQFVAVACHYDIVEWLQPDWTFEPGCNTFTWRALQRRPPIGLEICKTDTAAWKLFGHHHYLDHALHRAARCFVGLVEGNPAVFTAVLHFPHPTHSGWREHRTVCLPDYQGVGLGNAMSEFVAGVFRATGKAYRSTTSNPAMIFHRARSGLWHMTRKPSHVSGTHSGMKKRQKACKASDRRLTASFEFRGPTRTEEARGFGISPVDPSLAKGQPAARQPAPKPRRRASRDSTQQRRPVE